VSALRNRERGAQSLASRQEVKMNTTQMRAVIGSLAFSLSLTAHNAQAQKTSNKLEPLPRDLEIQLALSALPPHLRDGGTVYVLNPDKGFEVARKGSNGFHTFVARTGEDTMHGSWPFTQYRDDILYPVSFDAAGATAHMRVFFDIAELQAKGTPAPELKKLIQNRYKTGYYKAPARAGLSYMVSPILRTYIDPLKDGSVETTNNPHVMHYAPNITNEQIAGVKPAGDQYPHVTVPGPHGFVVQPLGKMETAAITKQYSEMLERLCKIKKAWCLPASQAH
jgi:hypothetical protein